MVLAAAYATLLIHRWIGLGLLVATLLPLDPAKADAYWNRTRLIFGLVWLGMVGWIFWFGATDGWLGAVDRDAVLRALTWIR